MKRILITLLALVPCIASAQVNPFTLGWRGDIRPDAVIGFNVPSANRMWRFRAGVPLEHIGLPSGYRTDSAAYYHGKLIATDATSYFDSHSGVSPQGNYFAAIRFMQTRRDGTRQFTVQINGAPHGIAGTSRMSILKNGSYYYVNRSNPISLSTWYTLTTQASGTTEEMTLNGVSYTDIDNFWYTGSTLFFYQTGDTGDTQSIVHTATICWNLDKITADEITRIKNMVNSWTNY